ncbi:GATA transcription factor 4 [Nymphaea thermarum]|nr:GATA transcription factor 4 [Nymphaea thermarum]
MTLDHIDSRSSLKEDWKPFYSHNMESFFDFSLDEIEELNMESEDCGTDLQLDAAEGDLPIEKYCIPMDSLTELGWDLHKDSQLQWGTPGATEHVPRSTFVHNFQAPVKARSKGLQTGRRVWSLNVSFGNAWQVVSDDRDKPAIGKENLESSFPAAAAQQGGARRCSHCLSEKTPQWRMGPLGPKTLCNACGVRYKSGRLLPEYRPAASPTFVSTVHSNSHRKVMEMRRKKGSF